MITNFLLATLVSCGAGEPLHEKYDHIYPCSPCADVEYENNKKGKNPLRLKGSQLNMAAIINCMAVDYGTDPVEMVAIAWVETRLKPHLVNRFKDAGMFQVNCRIHWKRFGYDKPFRWIKNKKKRRLKAIKQCIESQMDVEENFRNAVHILDIMKSKRTCRGTKAYACYNGGPGWALVHKKRASGYRKKVVKIKKILEKHYPELFDFGC